MNEILAILFPLLEKYGDQTSVDFLMQRVKKVLEKSADRIVSEQIEIIEQTTLSPEKFMGEIDDDSKFPNQKIEVRRLMRRWESVAQCMENEVRLCEYIRMLRCRWRENKGIKRDCRKYVGGQPDRNMVKTTLTRRKSVRRKAAKS